VQNWAGLPRLCELSPQSAFLLPTNQARDSGAEPKHDSLSLVVEPNRGKITRQKYGRSATSCGTLACLISVSLALLGLLAACKGGGGHHHGGGGGGGSASCAAGEVSYFGDEAGGGDNFLWCISGSNNTFAINDVSTNASATTGNFTTNANLPNLLTLTSTTPSAGTGDAVEQPNAMLLVNLGTLPTGSLFPTQDVVALVFEQSGFCPSSGSNYQAVGLPKSDWTPDQTAYTTVSLAASNVTLTSFALNGTSTGSESDSYTCDPTTSLITFTDSKGKQHYVATSPTGLFIDEAGSGAAGLLQATANVTLTPGDTYLGMLYEPNTTPVTTTVGFTVAPSGSSLTGFAPSSSGFPANGININLGSQTSAGLFTGGSLVQGTDNDTEFTAIANTVNGKIVLFGITFDTTTNTPVTVLLSQQ